MEKEKLMLQVINFKKNSDCVFLSSPYILEDGIKSNQVYLKSYFEALFKITNNNLISLNNQKLSFVSEEMDSTVDRVLLWLESTKAAENLKVYDAIQNSHLYPIFKKSTGIWQSLDKDIKAFFKDLDVNILPQSSTNDILQNPSLILESVICMSSYQFTLDDIKTGHIQYDTDSDCMKKIDDMSKLLDVMNFKTESIKETVKIRSSYQDTEHLKHAWKADYFITDDNNLKDRGAFIYSLLGLKIEFLNKHELTEMMRNYYK